MPGARRFYVTNKQGLGKDLVLRDAEHNHLANVLRSKVGDEIIIVCGDEYDYYYHIKSIAKSQTALDFIGKKANIYNPKKNLTVYIGIIKHDNLALVVEKLNEIGASRVVLFKSAHCQNIPVKIDKLRTIAQQSCKQCGRSIPLTIGGVLTIDELLKEVSENTVFADEKADPTNTESITNLCGESSSAIIIGPEGGFTDAECASLRKAAKPITLGRRILRAETAAIIGASLLLSKMGEL